MKTEPRSSPRCERPSPRSRTRTSRRTTSMRGGIPTRAGRGKPERPVIEFDRALLGEFAAEILEHVAACEQVLVRASTEPVTEQGVNLLLRSVHSIKGLARVLASTSLERLTN